jgi:hypothetical protein
VIFEQTVSIPQNLEIPGGPIAAICQHILGLSAAKAIELNWSILNTSLTIGANGGYGSRRSIRWPILITSR